MSSLEKGEKNASEQDLSFDQHSPERIALEKKLLRKIDLRMSILIPIYILNYIDRNNAAAARNRGLTADLHLKGEEFPTLLSILYVGNMMLNWMGRPSLYLPGAMIIWGVISVLTGAIRPIKFPSFPLNSLIFTGALLTRFFLGFVEAAFFPCVFLCLWFIQTKATYIAARFSCSPSGILANMGGKLGHAAWRWLFYIEGAITVAIAVIAIFILPDFPSNSKWLTEEERELALLRMKEDVGVGDQSETETGGPLHGLRLALGDWKVWWMAFALTAQVVALSFNAFFPTLTGTLNYNPTVTLLLCAPPFAFAAAAAFILARHSDKTGERCFHMISSFGLGILGFVIAVSTMNTAARYISLFLMAQSYAGFVVMYAWMSNSFPRPPSKRAVALALMNAWSQLGNIAGSYVWPTQWGPTYKYSYAICIACSGTTIVMCLCFRLFLQRENARFEKEEEEQGTKTPGFRYRILRETSVTNKHGINASLVEPLYRRGPCLVLSPSQLSRRRERRMNSLTYLSKQFDALASAKTPPSTPSSEHGAFITNNSRRASGSESSTSSLPRVQTWSKSFLFAARPSSSTPIPPPKRSFSSPAAASFALASQRAQQQQQQQPQSPTPLTSPSVSLETPPGSGVRTNLSPLHRTFLMRILVLAWNTLRAAWASLSGRTFGKSRLGAAATVVATEKDSDDEEGDQSMSSSNTSTEDALYMSPRQPPSTAPPAIVAESAPLPIPPPLLAEVSAGTSRSSTPPTTINTRRTPFHLPKTLVLDLDETLIHSTSRPLPSASSGFFGLGKSQSSGHMVEVVLGGHSTLYHVHKRPFADFFLRTVSGWYTLVIFTASMKEYADPIIDWLDAGRGILEHRLFRDSCTQLPNGSYTKELSVVDSDLSRVCLIDNSPISYRVNEGSSNGIPIEGWTHDPSDEALLDLLPFFGFPSLYFRC
ncbi:FCP1-like proteiny domain-containing protein [Mycena kentingensis (nom. inval.)]|nr:FCP1-like proteiny domain-containing protein [Mycena kentingensis (nom. inval.)]